MAGCLGRKVKLCLLTPGELLGGDTVYVCVCVCGVTRVKHCSSRARVCVHVNIHFDISFEMLWMIEKLVMFFQGGVSICFPHKPQRSFLAGVKCIWK